MSSYQNLTPISKLYITPYMQYLQSTQNTVDITINDDNVTAGVTPYLSTDGSGRIFLNGSVAVSGTPAVNLSLATFPAWCVPLKDYIFSVPVLRAGAYVSNAIKINVSGNSIGSITVTNPGANYTSVPTVTAGTPGTGAVLTASMLANGAVAVAAGTGYVPAETLTVAGGTTADAATLTIATTKVVSATIAAAGAGGTDGSQTVTGTTGTGTRFEAQVTIAGGIITAVDSISVAGSYTVNPTSISNEPVTGASLTGAELAVVMGVDTVTVLNAGEYSALPANPAAVTGSSGTGATFTVDWGVDSVAVTSAGVDYSSDSVVTFTGGAGTGAAATVVVDDSIGVELVNSPNVGDQVYLDGISFMAESYVSQ